MLRPFRLVLIPLLGALIADQSTAVAQTARRPAAAPAAASSSATVRPMIAAANPVAVDAGLKVLREGGSAVDAAVAVQAVLGLVEPQSSGLGGGSFMVFYDAKTKQVTAYDGREVAPAAATPDWFVRPDGTPMNFPEAVRSGRSTGVPGAIAMLALAQKEHGKKPWSSLFGDAERLAENGFVVNARLAAMGRRAQGYPDVAAYLTKPNGQMVSEGDVLKNPAYAATIRKVAAEGPKALLEGDIAKAIVARVGAAPNPSPMTLADLAGYKPQKKPALCKPYRVYLVCVPPAPSGGPGLLEGLGILANTDIAAHGPTDPQGWYLFAEGSRLTYAVRAAVIGAPPFVSVPVEGLLNRG
jgi:gamma-glutamyltranspeptidase/glutathione hydrolase